MPDFKYENSYADLVVGGVDEVGRGPLAGPVVAACVVIPPDLRHFDFVSEIRDSKKLSLAKRLTLSDKIKAHFPHAIYEVSPQEIDQMNILQASLHAMKRACEAIEGLEHVLVDGNKLPALPCGAEAIVKGDSKSYSIAAASILAKAHRDQIMAELCAKYPHYGWSRNSGYPTAEHRAALKAHGITPHHRKSFHPVREVIEAAA